MILRMETLGLPHSRRADERGLVTTWIPAPGVLVTRAEGYLLADLAGDIERAGNDVIEMHGRLIGFHDWSQLRGYESAARVRLTDWGVAVRHSVDRVHLLIASKLVRMGVAVASIVLGGMLVAHDDPVQFARELEAAVRARRPP